MSNIFDRIDKLIEHESLTTASFAKKIGISDQTIRNIVTNKRNAPSLLVLSAICKSFEWLNTEWLILGIGDMMNTKSTNPTTIINEKLIDIISSQQRDSSRLAEIILSQQRMIEDLSKKRVAEDARGVAKMVARK